MSRKNVGITGDSLPESLSLTGNRLQTELNEPSCTSPNQSDALILKILQNIKLIKLIFPACHGNDIIMNI